MLKSFSVPSLATAYSYYHILFIKSSIFQMFFNFFSRFFSEVFLPQYVAFSICFHILKLAFPRLGNAADLSWEFGFL